MSNTNKKGWMDKITDKSIEALAIAITRQAAEDYEAELMMSRRKKNPTPKLVKLDKWFDSEFGQLCSFGNGQYIKEQIKRGVKVSQSEYHKGALSAEDVEWIKAHYIPRHHEYGLRPLANRFGVSISPIRYALQGRYNFNV